MKPNKTGRKNTEAPVVDITSHSPPVKSEPRLPHERDEKAGEAVAPPRDKIKQAHDDLASGQRDTDCRNSAVEIVKPKPQAPKGPTRKR
jgi:hypothetical protein